MKYVYSIVIIVTLGLSFSCDNSIRLTTDWKETTVVYSFIDHNDSITYIKVTKAFLGNDNVLSMAMVRDSSEYGNISVIMEKYMNKHLVKTFAFESIIIDDKDSGIFYSPYQTIYAAVTKDELPAIYTPNTSYTYKIKVINNSGNEVGVEIPLVGETINVRNPNTAPTPNAPLPSVGFMDKTAHQVHFQWDTVANAFYYEMSGEFEFLEVFANGDTMARTVTWNKMLTTTQKDRKDGTPTLTDKSVYSIGFFNMCLQKIPYTDKNTENSVLKRRIGNFTLVFKIADSEYYQYVSAGYGFGGISTDLPNYTNVNNGLGLVSSRTTLRYACTLSDSPTKSTLLYDEKYDHLKFKSFQ